MLHLNKRLWCIGLKAINNDVELFCAVRHLTVAKNWSFV